MDKEVGNKALTFRWIIFAVLGLAYLFVYFHRVSLSVVAGDLARDFHTSAGLLGLLGSIYFYCYSAMQFPAGLLSDSIGPRKTVTLFLVLACLGSVLFGMASGVKTAFAARVMVGLGVSMVFIPTMKILSQWFRREEFAFMAGLLQGIGGAGVLAGTWALGLVAERVGWRISFELIGGLTLVILALVWLIVRDKPGDKGWPAIIETPGQSASGAPVGIWASAVRVVSERHFWPVAIWFFFDCGIFFGFGGLWSGPYLMHAYGMDKPQAGRILGMLAWGMIIGGPLLGLLSERVLKSRKKTLILCTAVLVGLLIVLNIYPAGLPAGALYGWFFLFSVCSSAIVVMGFTVAKELFPVEIAGTSVGAVNFFPFFGGAVFQPLLGWLLDTQPKDAAGRYSIEGYRLVLLVLLGAALAAMVCTFIMKETYRRPADKQ